MTLLAYFKSLYPVDFELEMTLDRLTESRQYNKGDIIFEPNTYLKHIYFVESGFTRVFYHKNNKDITHYFCEPATFSTGIDSVFHGKSSLFGFQALSNSRVTLLPFGPIQVLAERNIVVNKMIQNVMLDSLISFSNRFYHTQFQTAAERYKSLLVENPELLQNASLGHIASYLGISQQTLSVIRGQIDY